MCRTAIASGNVLGNNGAPKIDQKIGPASQNSHALIGMLGQHGAGLGYRLGDQNVESRQDHLPNSRHNCLWLNNNTQMRNIEVSAFDGNSNFSTTRSKGLKIASFFPPPT